LLLAAHGGSAWGENAPPRCHYGLAASLPIRFHGHSPMIEAVINGTATPMLVDTGSMSTWLTGKEVERRGLRKDEMERVRSIGISGTSTVSRVTLDDITIGVAHGKDTEMMVVDDIAGRNFPYGGVIGADFFFRSDVEISYADQKIKLFVPSDCDDAFLGYWDTAVLVAPLSRRGFGDDRLLVQVEINGKRLHAMIDSGAQFSLIDTRLARDLGITPGSPGVVPIGNILGIGTQQVASWVGPFSSFKIGDEEIRNVKIRIGDMWGAARSDMNEHDFENMRDQPHMLLGADFLRAHHVLFAVSQKRFYFSYVGGRVFETGLPPPTPAPVPAPPAAP
jgi:predicted aspartyl protease